MAQPFTLSSFRGGLNLYDPPTALSVDQVVEATNVELVDATCGGRRMGHSAITLPAAVTGTSGVWKMHRHLPSSDASAAQLWVMTGTIATNNTLVYKSDAVWTSVALTDTPTLTEAALSNYVMQSLHGKLFVSYLSASTRLHVWDGTTFRRAGLAAPAAAPTGANVGVGTLAGIRYYRVRYTVMSGTTVLRRSEPSTALAFSPSGTGTTVRITKPATISESETHWEIEASLDNSNFYRLSQIVVATTTYDDLVAFASGYAGTGTLSEDIGDYTTLRDPKYLLAHDDRLLLAGDRADASLGSRVTWTPKGLALGVGNDERSMSSTDPFVDLDGYEGGEITGIKANNGVIYVFKWSHIYRLVKSSNDTGAYDPFNVSKTFGAIPGSIVSGTDPAGNPALFFLDSQVGPCMIGVGGMIQVGIDIKSIWDGRATTGTIYIYARGVYYPDKRQVRWAFTESGSTGTTQGIILHTDKMQVSALGGRRGWTLAEGGAYNNITDMILYSDNIESGAARSTRLVPFISRATGSSSSAVLIGESGTTDDTVAYSAAIKSRPVIFGGGVDEFGVRAAALIATSAAGVTVNLSLERDFGIETNAVPNISLAPTAAGETYVIPFVDNMRMMESKALAARLYDSTPATGTWKVHQITLVPSEKGQTG